ncbi:class I SAM-dependent methyltransferase [Pandoraea oxalativorans]|uniref:Methyltransferase type 11 domain-containing protein n=1 Tax=Pandoraea oxalativorans TaxID=573737 RepID=A0A0G3IFG9_9BURK|nr:methyltransferase domain-containing protein [Pandoraea oxalativorans]AKK24661.1 hypothetical protein MB84_27885 [Pandoraea oxalativorans]
MPLNISFSPSSYSQIEAIEQRFVALKPEVSDTLKACAELKLLLPQFIKFLKDGDNARHSEDVAHFLMGKIDARQLPPALRALGKTFNHHEYQPVKTELYELVATHRHDRGIMGYFLGRDEPREKTIAKLEWLNARLNDINESKRIAKARQADNIELLVSKTDVNGKKVLDVGSGLCFNSAAMSNLGGDVYSVDPDNDATTSALALGNTTLEKLRPTLVEDVVEEFRDSVDLATVFYFLIPFDVRDSAFKALCAVMKQDGKVVITTEDDDLKNSIVEHGTNYFSSVAAFPRGSKDPIRLWNDPVFGVFGGLWQITLERPIKPSSI